MSFRFSCPPSASIIDFKVWQYQSRQAQMAGRTPPPPPSNRGAFCAADPVVDADDPHDRPTWTGDES